MKNKVWKKSVLLIISAKLGLNSCNPDYLPIIIDIMKLPQFVGMLGGRNKEALYFVGFHDQ